MSISLLTAEQLFGLFELDASGTVLYYRTEPGGERNAMPPDMAGHNFYDEVAPFENVEEFRRCVTAFTQGPTPADSFNFECRYEGSGERVKVLLARISERVNQSKTKSVLVHFRRSA